MLMFLKRNVIIICIVHSDLCLYGFVLVNVLFTAQFWSAKLKEIANNFQGKTIKIFSILFQRETDEGPRMPSDKSPH